MSKDLIIFGTGKITEVIYYYAKYECGYNVVAFAIDKQYKEGDTFHGLPVVDFETVEKEYAPEKYNMFVAVGYQNLNELRESKYQEAIAKGYDLVSIVSPNINLPGNVSYGKNCFIMSPSIIHPFVEFGNNVFVWSGAVVGHHSSIGDHCWITSGVNIAGSVKTGKNVFFAVNATVTNEVVIGDKCFLGANVLISKNMNSNEVAILSSTPILRLNSQQFLKMSSLK